MPFVTIDGVAPQVISGIGETIHIDDFTPITGVAKYKGCFIRVRKKSTDNVNLPFDTILLSNGSAWSATETVGTDTFNNKPLGIIGSYPEKINDVDGGNCQGKLTVHLLSGKQPIYVAFRLVNSSYNYIQPTLDMIGKQVAIHGKQENIGGTNYIVPVVSQSGVSSPNAFYVKDVIIPPKLANALSQKDYGWVVVALHQNFIVEPF
jgi:hypothetical protein